MVVVISINRSHIFKRKMSIRFPGESVETRIIITCFRSIFLTWYITPFSQWAALYHPEQAFCYTFWYSSNPSRIEYVSIAPNPS